jgi:hypothetical protein
MFGFSQADEQDDVTTVVPTEAAYQLTDEQKRLLDEMEQDEDGMVLLGEVSHDFLNQQTQYASRYLTGMGNTPNLSEGLRTDTSAMGHNYHAFTIHKDDIVEFVARVRQYRWNIGAVEYGTF